MTGPPSVMPEAPAAASPPAVPEWTAPYEVLNTDARAPIVLCCDHASAAIPPALNGLGVPAADRLRHIGWDIGAAAITRLLAARFGVPAVLCGTSRLVVDCNRHRRDVSAIPALVDQTQIPGNRNLPPQGRAARFAAYHGPYHRALAQTVERALATMPELVFVSVHSMTHQLRDRPPRPWPIALSHHPSDPRLAAPMLAALRARVTEGPVGDNQPYDLQPEEDFTTPHHAMARGLRHIQVEFRQDLVGDAAGAAHWAGVFGDALAEVLSLGR